MFGFFKNKSKKELVDEPKLTEQELVEFTSKLEKLLSEISEIPESQKEAKANIYEKIGLLQSDMDQVDDAIDSLEKSLNYQLSIGDGYKKLMSLYNQKRAMAAKAGDGDGIDFYMNKMDEMRQIAKKVTLSR